MPPTVRRTWVIEVCRTCGRLATWPFCQHREIRNDTGPAWCVSVTVTGRMPCR